MNRRAIMILTVGLAAAVTLSACGSGAEVVPNVSRSSTPTTGGQAATTPSTSTPPTSRAVVPASTAPASTAPASTAPAVSVPAARARDLVSSSTVPLPFATPEAAMRFLASAFNRGDTADLRRVTTPSAREALQEMHGEAVNLRLGRCTRQPAGDYRCTFVHDYPRALRKPAAAHGAATFTVGPADKPGWYMTVLESCG